MYQVTSRYSRLHFRPVNIFFSFRNPVPRVIISVIFAKTRISRERVLTENRRIIISSGKGAVEQRGFVRSRRLKKKGKEKKTTESTRWFTFNRARERASPRATRGIFLRERKIDGIAPSASARVTWIATRLKKKEKKRENGKHRKRGERERKREKRDVRALEV